MPPVSLRENIREISVTQPVLYEPDRRIVHRNWLPLTDVSSTLEKLFLSFPFHSLAPFVPFARVSFHLVRGQTVLFICRDA